MCKRWIYSRKHGGCVCCQSPKLMKCNYNCPQTGTQWRLCFFHTDIVCSLVVQCFPLAPYTVSTVSVNPLLPVLDIPSCDIRLHTISLHGRHCCSNLQWFCLSNCNVRYTLAQSHVGHVKCIKDIYSRTYT